MSAVDILSLFQKTLQITRELAKDVKHRLAAKEENGRIICELDEEYTGLEVLLKGLRPSYFENTSIIEARNKAISDYRLKEVQDIFKHA